LTQGLAQLVLLQPHDPINYLANFLLHYQHNKDRLAARDAELCELIAMRKQLPTEEDLCGLGAKTSALK
jgi:Dpy-30 motif